MERIDVSKLLKDCPSGMKLDSTMYENIVFDKIIEDDEKFPIRVIRSDGLRINLTKYGQYADIGSAKCIIFPEGKTTWKGFHRPFKNGDVIYVCDEYSDATYTYVAILKQIENFGEISSHCFYNYEDNAFSVNDFLYDSCNMRFATEKEKEELFKAIKDNGYEWNPESKTLEKLTESKEDTNEDIVMSGIYFDREYYADEVELHLGNYEIEIRNGKTYAVYKNQETKVSKPIFKVGDTIKKKGLDIRNPIQITGVNPKMYTFRDGSFQYVEIIDKDYVLVSRKFDISTLKPFDKVLVRDTKEQVWVADLFSHMVNRPLGGYTFACVGHYPSQCIPYEGNEHLLGTTDDCDEYFNLI
jgi:hypothetical protein